MKRQFLSRKQIRRLAEKDFRFYVSKKWALDLIEKTITDLGRDELHIRAVEES